MTENLTIAKMSLEPHWSQCYTWLVKHKLHSIAAFCLKRYYPDYPTITEASLQASFTAAAKRYLPEDLQAFFLLDTSALTFCFKRNNSGPIWTMSYKANNCELRLSGQVDRKTYPAFRPSLSFTDYRRTPYPKSINGNVVPLNDPYGLKLTDMLEQHFPFIKANRNTNDYQGYDGTLLFLAKGFNLVYGPALFCCALVLLRNEFEL
jgi:hypothetical protein